MVGSVIARVALLQAVGLTVYCSLVGLVFWQGEEWFGRMPNYWGPVLFLVLFVASALISALITLGYPMILIWQEKRVADGVRLIAYTAAWLALFVIVGMLFLVAR